MISENKGSLGNEFTQSNAYRALHVGGRPCRPGSICRCMIWRRNRIRRSEKPKESLIRPARRGRRPKPSCRICSFGAMPDIPVRILSIVLSRPEKAGRITRIIHWHCACSSRFTGAILIQLDQADNTIAQAEAQYAQAELDLMSRVINVYFTILAAQDD